jgi:BirA family biotin operon repressor/biotin-[acetyl-CoA-carboxylase] ligase
LSTKAPAWPQGYARLVLAEVDSTNAEAQRLAPGLTAPTWILGLRQTAGRGRRGRAWVDPLGNFAATLAIRLDEPPARLALRSFVAALALHEALAALSGLGSVFQLKWPNDVLLNGGKLSGILLESAGQGVLALGIGVNLRAAPPAQPDAGFAPVSLRDELGLSVLPEELLNHLAPAYATWEQRLVTYGFEPIRNAFLTRVARLGEPLIARTQSDQVHGLFETIDDTGALVLKTAQGRVSIPAADIFFP